MSQSFIEDGRRCRWVEYRGDRWVLCTDSGKLYLYDQYGIVYVGPGYSYTLPSGRVLGGYTDDPFFVQHYREMWAEGAALGVGAE